MDIRGQLFFSTYVCIIMLIISSTTCSASFETCTTSADCPPPSSVSGTVTCFMGLCWPCENSEGQFQIPINSSSGVGVECKIACAEPGEAGMEFCKNAMNDAEGFCWSVKSAEGYLSSTSNTYGVKNGSAIPFNGICSPCVAPSTPSADGRFCITPPALPLSLIGDFPRGNRRYMKEGKAREGIGGPCVGKDSSMCERPPPGTALTCFNNSCSYCETETPGEYRAPYPYDPGYSCIHVCRLPGDQSSIDFCVSKGQSYCSTIFQSAYAGVTISIVTDGDTTEEFGGICSSCAAGFVLNPEKTKCIAASPLPAPFPPDPSDGPPSEGQQGNCLGKDVSTCQLPKQGSSLTCFNDSCSYCEIETPGEYRVPFPFGRESYSCGQACKIPGDQASTEFCKSKGREFCTTIVDSLYAGVTISIVTNGGLPEEYGGVCATCKPGWVVNPQKTDCISASIATPPPPAPPPPTSSIQKPPSPPSNVNPPSPGTSPPPDDLKKKIIISVSLAFLGAMIAGLVGLIFYCFQVQHKNTITRHKYPLADMLRRELKLKTVSNFSKNPGLQFRSSVDMLTKALDARQVLRPTSLLGTSTSSLALAMASVLNVRYVSSPSENETGFLVLFAKDCGEDLSRESLVGDIIAVIFNNTAWTNQLVLPASPTTRTHVVV